MNDDVTEIVQRYCKRGRTVLPSDEITYDLHIDADDAEEMLVLIQKSFGTKFDNLWLRDYFHSELEVSLARLIEALCALFGYRIETKKPLSVNHLCRVVEAGAWFDPETS